MHTATPASPSTERVVGTFVERQARAYHDRVYLSFEDQVVTYADLDANVNRLANGFLNLGVQKGDKVCLMLPNCPEFIYAWLGLARIGAVEVPVNTFHKGNILQYIINHSDATTILVDERYLEQLAFVRNELQHIKTVIVRSSAQPPDVTSLDPAWRVLSYQEVADGSTSPPDVQVRPSDLLAIFYTGGTTGPSKGVMITHNFALWRPGSKSGQPVFTGQDVYYCCLPLFHGIQLAMTLTPLAAGGTLALSARFSASRFWDEIRRYRATVFHFVGAMLPLLWAQPPRADDLDNPVRYARGNPVPADLHRAFEQRFGLEVLQSYSMTEAMPISANVPGGVKVGSSGRPVSGGYEVKVFDENDIELPPNTVGEFVVRPREPFTLMEGYYKMPEETLRAFRNLWFHTGDIGYIDEDGYLFFSARKKESIRRSGENISSFEVEQVVNAHPAVAESAAIPVPSATHGEEVKIVVVLREGVRLSPEELLEFCQQRMAYFMVPRYVEFVDSLPKTAVFRVEKYRLVEQGITANTWDRESVGFKVRRG
ncbi:MAG: AMP-binding protein [Chloroflexi bacterium]|nr:AMP-binding protein [Chloroflexota bacterium]